MSSEFDQYFQEFLTDDTNEFDAFFKDDISSNVQELQHSDDWQVQGREVSGSDPTIAVMEDLEDPLPTLNIANFTLERMPETNVSIRSVIRTEAEMTAHLKVHWQETRKEWIGPRGCIWPDCSSRATFKSPSSLRSHIFNIHINPLVCTFPQCTYTNPFSKQCDLRRHVETIHEASCSYICPVEMCEANTKGFARKDKLLNHIREQHDILMCPYNHCSATVLETEQDAHLREFHDSYECALGACDNGLKSCFLELGLRRHLRGHHNITADPVDTLMAKVESSDKTARSSHIVRLRKWKDCPDCSEALSALGFAQNNKDFQTQNANGTSQG